MKRYLNLAIAVILLVTMFLTGCAPAPKPINDNPALAGPGETIMNPSGALRKAEVYYNEGYTLQKTFVQLTNAAVVADTEFRTGLLDLMSINALCFKNVGETEAQVAEAVMGDPNMPASAIIDVLATGGASVSGERATTECAKGYAKMADYVVSHRAKLFDTRTAAFNAGTEFQAFLHDQIGNSIINDVVALAVDNVEIREWMSKNLLGVTDFVWLPTNDLTFVVQGKTAQATCEYYISGKAITELDPDFVLKFSKHESDLKSLYKGVYNSNAGTCTLKRWAAFEKMMTPLTSSGTQDVYGTGTDQGVIPTPEK